ncbi:MAG: ORF6C domain-containing protein [Peptostreptococcaceae bacterium]|jgi:Rha family phage regulatory protein|nr:ORF6C domain-containing protein [Peptostreptococcaceae bacterium]
MNELLNQNEKMYLESFEVANMIGKKHKDLLRDIRKYIDYLGESKIEPTDFFIETTYNDIQNKIQPCYKLTKLGCELIANKLTGKKGVLFTSEYVKRFNDIEEHLKKQMKPMSAMQLLDLQYKALKNHEQRFDDFENKINKLENNLPLFAVDCKEIQSTVKKVGTRALGGYKTPAYNNNSVRSSIYSDIHKQIRREFNVNRYEAIKRNQINQVKEILSDYKPPLFLRKEIATLNNQLSIIKN